MMKRILLIVVLGLNLHGAFAACEQESRVYNSCKPGYYLDSGDCVRCPSSGGVYGTTVDKNTGGITSCYIPSGNSFSDTSGSGVYASDCYYTE